MRAHGLTGDGRPTTSVGASNRPLTLQGQVLVLPRVGDVGPRKHNYRHVTCPDDHLCVDEVGGYVVASFPLKPCARLDRREPRSGPLSERAPPSLLPPRSGFARARSLGACDAARPLASTE